MKRRASMPIRYGFANGRVAAGLFMTFLSASVGPCRADAGNCGRLMNYQAAEANTIESSTMVAANTEKKLSAFCEVRALIQPVPQSHIRVVYRLPEDWNG